MNDDYEALAGLSFESIIKPRSDDLLGPRLIRKPIYREHSCTLPSFSHENTIAMEVILQSRQYFLPTLATLPNLETRHPFSSAQQWADRAWYQAHALQYLELLVASSSPLMPRPAIFMDYVPWITAMVRVDDEEEQAKKLRLQTLQIAGHANGVKARMTRTSTRGVVGTANRYEFGRYITLDEPDLEMVRRTALVWKEVE